MEKIQFEFLEILKENKESETLPFVEKLSKEERKELRSFLIDIAKEYLEYRRIDNTYTTKANGEQSRIISWVAIFCLTKKEFNKHCSQWFFANSYSYYDKIMEIERIDWLANQLKTENRFNYFELMQCKEKGYFEPELENLLETLASCINYHYQDEKDKKWKNEYQGDLLEKYPETLKEHIWKLFEYETSINWTDARRYQYADNADPIWKFTFKALIEKGKLDRNKILKECLLTSNRNFNKVLTGWFFDLFLYLKPTEKELLEAQTQLFNALSSPQSKVVNGVLKIFKTLSPKDEFEVADFLDLADVLLSSEIKSIATATLMIFDKLIKKDKTLKSELCKKSTLAFSSQYNDVKLRAAKFIVKNGDVEDTDLVEKMNMYAPDLFSECKILLKYFLQEEADVLEEIVGEEEGINVLDESRKIKSITELDDFVFLGSQVFDNNEPYHLEQFLQGCLIFQENFSDANFVSQMMPTFQRAYKLALNWDKSAHQGKLDKLLSHFFIDYGKKIILLYPDSTKELGKMADKQAEKFKETHHSEWRNKALNTAFEKRTSDDNYIHPFFWKMNYVLNALENKTKASFLSVPTHQSFWIDPLVFVQHIHHFQKEGIAVEKVDLNMAISRVVLDDTLAAIDYAKKHIKDELKDITLYVLDEKAKAPNTKKYENVLVQAYLNRPQTKQSFKGLDNVMHLEKNIGKVEYKAIKEPYESSEYDFEKKKYFKVTKYWDLLKMISGNDGKIKSLKLTLKEKYKFDDYFISNNSLGFKYMDNSDTLRMFSLCPNNPERFFYMLMEHLLKSSWAEAEEKKVFSKVGEILFEFPYTLGKTGHVLVAAGLLNQDKAFRAVCAEYWMMKVGSNEIDSALLGNVLGVAQTIEYGPLKRFTDLAQSQMANISKIHNEALLLFINNMIPQMPSKPIKNTKKILEILLELKMSLKIKSLDKKVSEKLELWKSSASLKKVIASLEK